MSRGDGVVKGFRFFSFVFRLPIQRLVFAPIFGLIGPLFVFRGVGHGRGQRLGIGFFSIVIFDFLVLILV